MIFRMIVAVLLLFTGIYIFSTAGARPNAKLSERNSTNARGIPDNIAYGKPTIGGLDGKVIKVTNLNIDGPGSLNAALQTKGPRIIIFEVAGVIDLNKSILNITQPYLTVAGQTAPSPGITIIKGGINIKTHDVIIQHIRIRPGDAGQPKQSGFEPDGLSTIGEKAYNIIVDHCSFTWSVDENLSASGSRNGVGYTSHNITFSNNIIAEGLLKSSHAKGSHSMGILIHDFVQDIVIVGNFFSCNNWRNPFFKAFTKGAVTNNLIYNPGVAAIHMNWHQMELSHLPYPPKNAKISIVGNVLYEGTDSKANLAMISGKGDAYLEDNLAYGVKNHQVPMVTGQINLLNTKPSWPDNFKALPSYSVKEYVLKYTGARPKDRDIIDKRIINDFIKREGKIINSQDDVGGYPNYRAKYRKLNVPVKGVNKWLANFIAEV